MKIRIIIKPLLIKFGLVFLAVILFALSFPNIIFVNGLSFLAFIAYVPVFYLIYKVKLGESLFWGALYGYFAFWLFNYWLSAFHPLAGIITFSVYMVYNAVLFFFLRLALILYPKFFFIVWWLVWLAYEYLRSIGFLGYTFGITGYSQWQMIPIIQIAEIFGVWGVSALVIFPSSWFAALLKKLDEQRQINKEQAGRIEKKQFRKIILHQKPLFISIIIWFAALTTALVYGFIAPKDYTDSKKANIALIQHNSNPWKSGIIEYRKDLNSLKRLSDAAVSGEIKPDLVVWPETAFVPRIYWHETYRDDQASWILVKELLDYLKKQDIPFIIGNDDARMDPARDPNEDQKHRVDYNAAMFYEKGKNNGVYRKIHLVPFTEYFPYKKQFPGIYRFLENEKIQFWEKGAEYTVFSTAGFTFSTPICFEDTFGYISRKFVQKGADLIVNLTNDSWSNSLPAQNQHLSTSVFRAVENRRSVVRSAVSGQTCGIDPNGRIINMAIPFTETHLTVAIPIVKGYTTIYNCWGDFIAVIFTITAIAVLILGSVKFILKIIIGRRKR